MASTNTSVKSNTMDRFLSQISLDLQSLFNPAAGGDWLSEIKICEWDSIGDETLQA